MRSKKPEQGAASPEMPSAAATSPLFTSMDHQIHTSMNGVLGMLELLRGTDLTPMQQEFADMAQTSAENLLRLFDGMLDFSRLSAGTLVPEQLPFDLFREIDAACAAHKPAAERKNVTLSVHAAPDAHRLMIGDAARIGHVISTLIGNAVERTANGTIRIDVEAIAQPDGRCRLCVCASDPGIGAGREFADIFNGVRPVSPADPQQGTARLGLAFSRSLIELMGGHCGADNEPQGGKFWFSLNLPPAASVLDGVRVLLIDDLASTRKVLEQQLRKHGMRADGFGSTADALLALGEAYGDRDPYRIAIMNEQMADMDGETLGAAIKADPAYTSTLLVILSADPDRAPHFMQAGFSAAVTKPVVQQVLLDTLAILCGCLNSRTAPPFVADAVILRPEASGSAFAGRRVLVVDDDLANCRIAVRMLEKLGCRADFANGGRQAVAMHDQAAYDLILMDCQMPEVDGYQATAMIRATEAGRRHTPLIAWTTNALQHERKKCAAAGMDDLIAKPIRAAVLREVLSRWLPAAGPENGAGAHEESDELESMQELFGASFGELAALYRSDTPKRMAALSEAAGAGDRLLMAKIAHSISGSCASIGATRLAALCQDLELRCKAGDMDEFAPRLGAIRSEYARIETKLQAMVQSATV